VKLQGIGLIIFGSILVFAGNLVDFQHQTNGIPILLGSPGVLVGNATSLTIVAGAGIAPACTPSSSGAMQCTFNLSPIAATKQTIQNGVCDYIVSSNGSTAYTYQMGPVCQTLSGYVKGMHLLLNVDVANVSGSCTLNIDNNGPINIKDPTGLNDLPANNLAAGESRWIWFDGQVFRVEHL
jgi:hypothetical protein